MKFIDELLQAAESRGEFRNLPGQGQPLNLEPNPYGVDTQMAYKIVKDSGYSLAFIEERRKLVERIETLREQLRKAAAHNDGSIGRQLTWQMSLDSFHAQVDKLNRAIQLYNLKAPRVQFHLLQVDAAREIAAVASQ